MDSLETRLLANETSRRDLPFLYLVGNNTTVRSFTYGECLERARRWAATYQEQRLPAGSVIVISLRHSLDLYASFLGALLGGYVPTMFAFPSEKFDSVAYGSTIDALLANAAPAGIVASAELAPRLREATARGASPAVVLTPEILSSHATMSLSVRGGDDVAFLQYSSGTTGLRKGVAVTHRAALWQLDRYRNAIALGTGDLIASWLPLYHDMGLVACCLLPFVTGTRLLAASPHDWVRAPLVLLHRAAELKATLWWMPNFAFSFLAKNISARDLSALDLSSLRGIVNCSEPILAASHRRFLERFAAAKVRPDALATSYAMAENTFAVTSGGFGSKLREELLDRTAFAQGRAELSADAAQAVSAVSSGTPLPGTVISIVDEAGAPLPDRCVGEIAIASGCLFDGYRGNAGETAARLRDGVFYSGDLGYQAEGHLFVTGRQKDLIIVAGRNIYPHDLEEVVTDTPGVRPGRCVAFGVTDDAKGTERLVILAETDETAEPARAALSRLIASRVAACAEIVPDDVRLVPARWLQKSSSGKIARRSNRERYLALRQAAVVSDVQEISAGEMDDIERALACIRRVLATADRGDLDSLSAGDRVISSGLMDSLTLVALVLEVERIFQVRVPPTHLEVGHFDSAERIVTLVRGLSSQTPETLKLANRVATLDDRDKACEELLVRIASTDLLILGSSKAKQLSPAVAGEAGYRAFNFWLASSRAEDWYAAVQFAACHGAPLREVVVVVDIEGFSNAVGPDHRLVRSARLRPFLFPETIGNFPVLEGQVNDRFQTLALQFAIGQDDPMSWNGFGRWMKVTDRAADPSRSEAEGRSPLTIVDPHDSDSFYALRMRGFTRLSPIRVRYFRELVTFCTSRGIRVRCALAPLHPVLDAWLSASTTYAARIESFERLMTELSHPLVSFHDTRVPAAFGGTVDDFSDAAHIGYANSDILLRFLLSSASAGGATPVGPADASGTAA